MIIANRALDPWTDAEQIAQHLARPGAELLVVVGAAQWCQKCRDFYPHFELQRSQGQALQLHLWLDLEEHAEFLGDFVPDDLPLLLHHQNGLLVQSGVVRGWDGPHWLLDPSGAVPDPSIWRALTTVNWAG